MIKYLKKKDCQGKKLPDFLKECMNYLGKLCLCYPSKKPYIFRGVAESDEDYYYIVEDNEGEIHYVACIIELEFSEI